MDAPTPKHLPARRPTLRDVAKAAGVTAAAVSYVVNGRTDQVSAETSARILEAIKTVRYQPQRRGLSLRLSREFAIGLVILDPDPNFLADPFTTQVAAGLSNALIDPGYSLMVTGVRSLSGLEAFLSRPVSVDALAVIVSGEPVFRQRAYKLISRMTVPVVVVQERAPSCLADACAVLQDDRGGAELLTRHVLERGARSILFVAPERSWPAIERREAGVVAALGGRGCLQRIKCDEQDHAATLRAIANKVGQGSVPDAILGGNDQIAIAVLKVLAQQKLQIPGDVRVAGFNNFVFRNYTTPLLTTVTSAAYEIGSKVAEVVLSRFSTGTFAEAEVKLGVALTVGETT